MEVSGEVSGPVVRGAARRWEEEEKGTEAVAFIPGATRPFSFAYEWDIDASSFSRHFATNKTHSQLKKTLTLKRIRWLLLCHRKPFNSYRQSFLFSIQPLDAQPEELLLHKATIRVRAAQPTADAASTHSDLSVTLCQQPASSFAELDLSNYEYSVSSFQVHFHIQGETTLGAVAEENAAFRDDITRLMAEPTVVLALAGGEEVLVHRSVLSRQSSVFAAMLRTGEKGNEGMREGREARVEIEDLSPLVVRGLLHWLYTGRVSGALESEEDASKLAELFLAADKYDVAPLKAHTERLLRENLNNDSVCTVFALADTFRAVDMKAQALAYILTNFNDVRPLPYFERMVTQHPHLSLEILRNVLHQ